MEPRIKDRFNDEILTEAMRRYGIAEGHIHLLDGFESFMYEFDWRRGGLPVSGILRIGHSLRRTPMLIQGEVDWINYLADGGAGWQKPGCLNKGTWWKLWMMVRVVNSWSPPLPKRAASILGWQI